MAHEGVIGVTTSDEVPMPAKRTVSICEVTGAPAQRFRYRVTQDVTDAHGGVELLLISEDGERRWASKADWKERTDPAVDVWDLLIRRLVAVDPTAPPEGEDPKGG